MKLASLLVLMLALCAVVLAQEARPYGSSQETRPYKAKPSHTTSRPAKSAPAVKTPNTAMTAKELQKIEAQSAKVTTSKATHPKQAARQLGTDRTKSAPINLGGGAGTTVGMTNQGKNPYKGRLRQKNSRH